MSAAGRGEAEAALLERLRAERGNPELYDRLGDLYAADPEVGEKALRNYLEAARLLTAGSRAPRPERAARAAVILAKAVPLARARDPVLFRLAQALEMAGQSLAAERAYRELLEHALADERPLFHLALRDRIAALDPWDLEHRRATATARERLGMRLGAAEGFAELSRLEALQGLAAEALADAEHAVALAPVHPSAREAHAAVAGAGSAQPAGPGSELADAWAAPFPDPGPREDLAMPPEPRDAGSRDHALLPRGVAALLLDDPALGAGLASLLPGLGLTPVRLGRGHEGGLPEGTTLLVLGTERLRGRSPSRAAAAFRDAGRPHLAVVIVAASEEPLHDAERAALAARNVAMVSARDAFPLIASRLGEAAAALPSLAPEEPEPLLPFDDLPPLDEIDLDGAAPLVSLVPETETAGRVPPEEGPTASDSTLPARSETDLVERASALERSLAGRDDEVRAMAERRDQALLRALGAEQEAREARIEAAAAGTTLLALLVKVGELSDEAGSLRHVLRGAEERRDEALRRALGAERESGEARVEAAAAGTTLLALLVKVGELSDEVASLRHALQAAEEQHAEISRTLEETRGRLETVGAEREAAVASAAAEATRVRDARDALTALREELEGALSAARRELDAARAEAGSRSAELEGALSSARRELAAARAEAGSRTAELEGALCSARRELDAACAEAGARSGELEHERARSRTLDGSLAAEARSSSELRAALEGARGDAEALGRSLGETAGALALARADAETRRAEAAAVSERLAEAGRRLGEEQAARAALARSLEERNADSEALRDRVGRLVRDVDARDADLRARRAAIAALEEARALGEAEIARGSDARAAALRRLEEALRETERVRDELLAAATRRDELSASVARLEAELALSREETSSLRESIARRAEGAMAVEKDRDDLKERLARADVELARHLREAEERARRGPLRRLLDAVAPRGGFGRGLALGLLPALVIGGLLLVRAREAAIATPGVESAARLGERSVAESASGLGGDLATAAPAPAAPQPTPLPVATRPPARTLDLTEYAAIEEKLVRRQERPGFRLTAKLRTPAEVRAWYGYQASVRGTPASVLEEELDGPGGVMRMRYRFEDRTYVDALVENLGLPGASDVNALASSFVLEPPPGEDGGPFPGGGVRGVVSAWEEPVVVAGSGMATGGGGGPGAEARDVQTTTLHLEFPQPLRPPVRLRFRPPGGEAVTLVWEAIP